MSEYVRPTKKQRELLDFIESFIKEHGYSPSYREIMNGLQYNSVATVALHVGNLIKRGHLRKRDHSARSLEVVREPGMSAVGSASTGEQEHETWLLQRVEQYLAERGTDAETEMLLSTLHILGLDEVAKQLNGKSEKQITPVG
jgi:SOS-response transcriptional repressor LexA